jgi:very-short-patch-repair endonuclease
MLENRNFKDLNFCKLCNKQFKNLNGLSNHLARKHKILIINYILKFELNDNHPLCKCGCNNKVGFYQNHFHDYLSGHISKTENFNNPWFKNKGKSPINIKIFSEDDIKNILIEFVDNHIQLKKLEIKYNCSINPLRRIIDKNIGKEKRQEIAKFNDCWRRKYDPIINKHVREAAMKGGEGCSKMYNTHIEIKMKEILKELNLQNFFNFQGRVYDKKTGNCFSVDFLDKNKKIIIECDGDYWHANPKIYNDIELNEKQKHARIRDGLKNKIFPENGYILLRFWENDFIKNIESIKTKMLEIKNTYYTKSFI